ncbi:SMI1/KNR4 family protein [Nostoc sp. CMAA1605]|uniref:SMI1/KNR4 family protein n=1 Tax=Nostoc sp. CMAA1605 TaxID=2055159 RepID=UPI001F372DFF|nr:SMI1/KNR4 family protein [Nostoc sp. CMAA1605]MCF4970538.1 hypothetical protein [Nostoc sp. CMAA1605]
MKLHRINDVETLCNVSTVQNKVYLHQETVLNNIAKNLMQPLPQDCAELFSQLTEQVKTAPPDSANEAVYQAGVLLFLAGYGEAAYQTFLKLLSGELRLSKASSLIRQLESSILPSLCYGLGIPYPATPNQEALNLQELTDLIFQNERQNRSMLLLDRFSVADLNLPPAIAKFVPPPPPIKAKFTDEYIQQMLGRSEQLHQGEISLFMQDAFRKLQVLSKNNQFTEALKLVDIYEQVCQVWQVETKDWISETVKIIAIDLCFRNGEENQAKEYLLNWWITSSRDTLSINTLVGLCSATRAFLAGVLRAVMNISPMQVDEFLDSLNNRTYIPHKSFIPSVLDWQIFMEAWNEKLFAGKLAENIESYSDWFSEAVSQKKCGKQGASVAEILELEHRLGKTLPPSYKNFLLYSNGWVILNEYCTLLGTKDVDWFYTLNQEWVDVWHGIERDEVDDETYFLYGRHQDPCHIRTRYMKTALQISTDEDGYVYLLNPMVIDEQGEWEAWDFGNKIAGAYRYRTFWDMMQAVYKRSFRDDK